MNAFSSFLDTSGPNMPRQAPSPSAAAAAAAAHQANGIGGPAGGNSIPMVNGLPSGGQQTDMNYLWSVVQQLSQMLEENRAQTAGIVNGVQAIQARAAEEGSVGGMSLREVNGELNAASRAAEIQSLSSQLTAAQTRANELDAQNTALHSTLADYESAITLILEKLRPYAYNHTQAMLQVHKHYQGLLETERASQMQIRLEQAEWQARLGRVADYARLAYKSQADADLPYIREIRELKEENRVLRRLAGWEERKDESDEDEEKKGL